MKTIDNAEVKEGDVLLEIGRGYEYDGEKKTFAIKLWELPKCDDGSGYEYNIDGKKSQYWWASVSNSYKVNLDIFPKEFRFSFYHGMSGLNTTIENGTVEELINSSNWKDKMICEKQVSHYNNLTVLKIHSINDIKNNINILSTKGYVPRSLMMSVFKAVSEKATNPDFGNFKGEIGIAGMCDMFKYMAIIEHFKENCV